MTGDHPVRLPEITQETARSAAQRTALQEEAASGLISNPARIYAYVPGVLRPLRELHQALAESATLDSELVSLVRLLVAKINGCPF